MKTLVLVPLFFAVISPFIWGTMNVLDKFAIAHRVKNPLSFTVIAGMVHLAIGTTLIPCLSWTGISPKAIAIPAVVGLIFGAQFYLYYFLLSKEDISNVIGLIYLYPAAVAVLSFIFIGERLSPISYGGMCLTLLGVLFLSLKDKKISLKVPLRLVALIVAGTAVYEFLIKVATQNLPELNGVAINSLFAGLAIVPIGLFSRKIRNGIIAELHNARWAMLNESLTFLGILTTYFAMSGLPATIVASIAASQPLCVLILESGMNRVGIRISDGDNFRKKLLPILLIVFGIVLLYLPEYIMSL